jgi:S-adenosylmethionine:tRNA ribosyltransferase-isomerase
LRAVNDQGVMPLPPYIKRDNHLVDDKSDYQTIFASSEGAVAAPTAGLHFTDKLINELEKKGIIIAPITLHVGAGTFLPVKVENVLNHKMHEEWGSLDSNASEIINNAIVNKKRIIALGTTSLRILETIAMKNNGKIIPWSGFTNLFITPGFKFNIVDLLITNFHLPKSTLLMLVSAFYGRENLFKAYDYAIKKKYRFFSYGDSCIFSKQKLGK